MQLLVSRSRDAILGLQWRDAIGRFVGCTSPVAGCSISGPEHAQHCCLILLVGFPSVACSPRGYVIVFEKQRNRLPDGSDGGAKICQYCSNARCLPGFRLTCLTFLSLECAGCEKHLGRCPI